jgi:hypothetical protein
MKTFFGQNTVGRLVECIGKFTDHCAMIFLWKKADEIQIVAKKWLKICILSEMTFYFCCQVSLSTIKMAERKVPS